MLSDTGTKTAIMTVPVLLTIHGCLVLAILATIWSNPPANQSRLSYCLYVFWVLLRVIGSFMLLILLSDQLYTVAKEFRAGAFTDTSSSMSDAVLYLLLMVLLWQPPRIFRSPLLLLRRLCLAVLLPSVMYYLLLLAIYD